MPISTSEALISLIGGFLPGYAQGRKFKTLFQERQAENQRTEQDKQTKLANEQKVFEQRQQKANEQTAGKKEAFGLLNAVGGLSPQTPAEEVLKIKSQFLDAADRGGLSIKEAQNIFDEAVKFRTPEQPSPLDRAKLSLEEQRFLTEQERTKKETALTARYKALTAQAKDKARQLKDEDLVSSINALRQLQQNLIDDLGEVPEENKQPYEELQTQIDAYLEENANRKGVKIPVKRKKEEAKNNDPLGIR